MKPIISPWLIYFASRADNLTTFFGVIAGICSTCFIIYGVKRSKENEFTKY